MQSLNIRILGISKMAELLSSGVRIKLKSPATTIGMVVRSTFALSSARNADDLLWSAGP
jgi:hypothetical protein